MVVMITVMPPSPNQDTAFSLDGEPHVNILHVTHFTDEEVLRNATELIQSNKATQEQS